MMGSPHGEATWKEDDVQSAPPDMLGQIGKEVILDGPAGRGRVEQRWADAANPAQTAEL